MAVTRRAACRQRTDEQGKLADLKAQRLIVHATCVGDPVEAREILDCQIRLCEDLIARLTNDIIDWTGVCV